MNHCDDASALGVNWWKSSFSDSGIQCVECAVVDSATVAVRDSKDPHGPALLLGREQFATLVDAVKRGEIG
jgi:hypothetical protein